MLNFSYGLKLMTMRMEITNSLQNRGIKNLDLISFNKLVVKECVQPLCQISHQELNVLTVTCFMAMLLRFTLNQGGEDGRKVSMLLPG